MAETGYNPLAPSIIPRIGQPRTKTAVTKEDVAPAPPCAVSDAQQHDGKGGSPAPRRTTRPTRPSGKPVGPLIVEVDPSVSSEDTRIDTWAATIASQRPLAFPICPTCNTNEGRYRCPRCSAPYCSVECYKKHDIPPTATASDSSGTPVAGGGRCTESFYKDRVEDFTNLEMKGEDNAKAMRNILARSAVTDHIGDSAAANGGGDQLATLRSDINDAVTDEELMQLAEALLGLDEKGAEGAVDSDGSAMELLESLPSHVREAFEASVNQGKLSHLVSQWKPWWEAELGPASVSQEVAVDKYSEEKRQIGDEESLVGDALLSPPTFGPSNTAAIDSGRTIDERILTIKSLHRGKPIGTTLQYNVIDILFGIVSTLRLYNGKPQIPKSQKHKAVAPGDMLIINNANADVEGAIGAAESFISTSAVLGNDERFEAVEEVMASCSKNALELSRMNMCNASWHADVATILSNGRRGVLRALLDGKDLLRGGGKATKLALSGVKTKRNISDADEASRRYKLAQKKIEFYLSWCLEYWDLVFAEENLSESITAWIETWKMDDKNASEIDSLLVNT